MDRQTSKDNMAKKTPADQANESTTTTTEKVARKKRYRPIGLYRQQEVLLSCDPQSKSVKALIFIKAPFLTSKSARDHVIENKLAGKFVVLALHDDFETVAETQTVVVFKQ